MAAPPLAINPPTNTTPVFSPFAQAGNSGNGVFELVYQDNLGQQTQLTNHDMGPVTMKTIAAASGVSVPTPGTSKATLASFVIPANALRVAGKGLRIRAYYITAANVNSKTMAIDFGSQTSVATKTTTTSADVVMLELTVIKSGAVGANTQMLFGIALATAASVPVQTAGTQAENASITVNITATTASGAADATLVGYEVEVLN